MAKLVAAVEMVVALPAYQRAVLGWGPEIARFRPGASGVFFGFDFHPTPGGPRLIEINTNAGGALLHLLQARAVGSGSAAAGQEEKLFSMFLDEWRSQRGDLPLRTIAIVDDQPEAQYLYPEFALFQRLFRRHGLEAVIADAAALSWRDGALWHEGLRVDLVYNRLTDFALAGSEHAALRRAYLADAAVVTPHPRAHALYADKRNLAVLGDRRTLVEWGVEPETVALLAEAIPPTVPVRPDNSEALWKNRRRIFFKPAAGYGSRGSYRGDKLTGRVWREILQGEYVAQEYVPPGEQQVEMESRSVSLKYDIRNYSYRGKVQLVAARLYQGQTTNFRTPGGGFALVAVPGSAGDESGIF